MEENRINLGFPRRQSGRTGLIESISKHHEKVEWVAAFFQPCWAKAGNFCATLISGNGAF